MIPAGTEVPYRVTFLEMTAPPDWPRPGPAPGEPLWLAQCDRPEPWWFLALYDAVGRDYEWVDQQARPTDELRAWLHHPDRYLHVAIRGGQPVGFFLLDAAEPGTCEIAYFGLTPSATGQGLGQWLLRQAIWTGWELGGIERMTVNTCTLDHPAALPTYRKWGFEPVRVEDRTRVLVHDRHQPLRTD